jgi:hypothetical protein
VDDLTLLAIEAETLFELTPTGRLRRVNSPERGAAPRLWLGCGADGYVVRLRHDVGDATAAAVEGITGDVTRHVTYVFPRALRYEHEVRVVCSDTATVDALPDELVAMGFADASHFWPPWCAALDAGTIVSVAFTARLSADGAEAGVATVPSARGRGFAAAATAAWAAHPALGDRVRFYSTQASNVSSQRVAQRLGLRLVGTTVSVA